MNPRFIQNARCWSLLFIVAVFACGYTLKRTVVVDSIPTGAAVTVNGVNVGFTPLSLPKQVITTSTGIKIHVLKDDYEPADQAYTADEARDIAKTTSDPLNFHFALARIRLTAPVLITSAVDGAQVFIDNQLSGPAPVQQTLTFSRADSNASWNSFDVRIEKLRYLTLSRHLTFEDAFTNGPSASQPWKIEFAPPEIERDIIVAFDANIPDTTLSIDDVPIGTVPVKYTILFTRTNASQPWPVKTIKIAKEGFEFRPPGKAAEPVYTRILAADDTAVTNITADDFLAVRFVSVPLRTFEIQGAKLAIRSDTVLAEVSQLEQGGTAPTQITHADAEHPLIASRISVFPDDDGDKIFYTLPTRERRPTSSKAADPGEIIGAIIAENIGTALTQITEPSSHFDIDPFTDGHWIYFSSNSRGPRGIWRKLLNGSPAASPITTDQSSIDTEPAVSPDGSRLAYTALIGSDSATPASYIYTVNADGGLTTQTCKGRSPAWSPDGKKIAFVSLDKKIWVMDPDGAHAAQLTSGDSHDDYPVWSKPLGKHIIFASDGGINDRNQHNYDIWMIASDGSHPTQLTSNGSYDSYPAISKDGRHVYFFSNRGSQKAGQENLQIFRIDIPGE